MLFIGIALGPNWKITRKKCCKLSIYQSLAKDGKQQWWSCCSEDEDDAHDWQFKT